MLISIDKIGKKGSIYKCDRCKAEVNVKENKIYTIFVKATGMSWSKKKWDLCRRCYAMLNKGVKKGGTNE